MLSLFLLGPPTAMGACAVDFFRPIPILRSNEMEQGIISGFSAPHRLACGICVPERLATFRTYRMRHMRAHKAKPEQKRIREPSSQLRQVMRLAMRGSVGLPDAGVGIDPRPLREGPPANRPQRHCTVRTPHS
jgi:hypothetical protein